MGGSKALAWIAGIGGGIWLLSKLKGDGAAGSVLDTISTAASNVVDTGAGLVMTGNRFVDLLPIFNAAATKYGVPLSYVLGISGWETRGKFDPTLVAGLGTADARRGGSFGVMQMSMKTARGLGYSGPDLDLNNVVNSHWQGALPPGSLLDPEVNIDFGVRYIANIMRGFGTNFADVAAGYNSGKSYDNAPDVTRDDYVPGAQGYQAYYTSYDSADTAAG